VGRYFFADYVQGRIWSLALTIDPQTGEARASDVTEHTADLSSAGALGAVSSFGVDADGELYVVGYARGSVWKIVGSQTAPLRPRGCA